MDFHDNDVLIMTFVLVVSGMTFLFLGLDKASGSIVADLVVASMCFGMAAAIHRRKDGKRWH